MSTMRRLARLSRGPEVSPAWHWTLMTGELPHWPAPGWVNQAQSAERIPDGFFDYETPGNAIWAVHGDALIAEAEAAGFRPYWATDQTPMGPAFDRWRDSFLAAHGGTKTENV